MKFKQWIYLLDESKKPICRVENKGDKGDFSFSRKQIKQCLINNGQQDKAEEFEKRSGYTKTKTEYLNLISKYVILKGK